LPSREEIESAPKYLKNNKSAGADSIPAKLLENGGPQLVDALEKVIQLAWTSETLPDSWTKRYCVQCTKKEFNSIAPTIEVVERCKSLHQSIIRPFVTLRQCGRSALSSWVSVRQINGGPTLCTAPN
jgi:hypothetical protein